MKKNAKQKTNKKTSGKLAQKPASKITASALDISESTVKVIMAAFNKKGIDGLNFSKFLQRGKPSYSLESGVEPLVRQFVRKANRNGDQVNVEIIRNFMQDELQCKNIAHTTLWRALQRWGFEFGKGARSQHLKEKDHVIAARQRYLRKKRGNRVPGGGLETVRPEVYLDES